MGASKNSSTRFNSLVKKVTVMPQRLDSQLPLEPVFDPATDLHPDLHKANPKLYMLEEFFGYTTEELEHCASKVGISEPVKVLSKTGLEKFRRVVEVFREHGLVMLQKNPDRGAIRCGLYHSRLLYDFMTDATVLRYFSRVAGYGGTGRQGRPEPLRGLRQFCSDER